MPAKLPIGQNAGVRSEVFQNISKVRPLGVRNPVKAATICPRAFWNVLYWASMVHTLRQIQNHIVTHHEQQLLLCAYA